MNNNEEKILFLEKKLSDLERLFNDHPHDGIGTKKIKYSNINDIPDTVVNDSDVVFTDITTGNASATKHGYLPKLSDDTSEFLRGDGTWSSINLVTIAADTIRQSADTERTSGGDPDNTYTLKKDIEIQTNGSIRIKFDLQSSNGSYNAYGRIYKNGSPVGTERITTSTSYVTYSEDFDDVVIGDNFQLYIHNTFSGGSGNVARCRNFRVYFDIVNSPTVITD
ncbi:MAG: hypothetical protein IPM48_14575 [Saprospiraceae bacterium]|nr:hypothetical protein [Saprospiraceae bacterium]